MIECVQGEGGVIALSSDFISGIYAFARENDIPLIVDESVKLFLYFRRKKSACLRKRRALRARGVTDAAYGEIPTPVGHDAHTAR